MASLSPKTMAAVEFIIIAPILSVPALYKKVWPNHRIKIYNKSVPPIAP
jgi:hypothetical protein